MPPNTFTNLRIKTYSRGGALAREPMTLTVIASFQAWRN